MQLGHSWSRPLATRKLQDHPWTICASYGMDYPLGMCCSPLYDSSCGRSWSCVRRCGYIVHLHAHSGAAYPADAITAVAPRTKTSDCKPWHTWSFQFNCVANKCNTSAGSVWKIPPSAASWNLDLLQDLLASGSSLLASGSSQIGTMVAAGNDMLKVRKYIFDSCRWGHQDPGNGKFYRKRQCFASNADMSCLCLRCVCHVRHQVVEGHIDAGPLKGTSRARVAGKYPWAFCVEWAKVIKSASGDI